MTTSRATLLLGAAISLATLAGVSTTGAFAADLGGLKDTYAPPPESRHQWYLKGFLGMHNYDSEDLDHEIWGDNFSLVHQDYKSAPFFGIGIGAVRNRWLRWDITGEYRGSSVFFAQDVYEDAGSTSGTGYATNEYTADIESWVGLANAYIDICTWRGITPFVGAGIGFAVVDVMGLKDVNVPTGGVAFGDDNTETNFAWAIHAGLAYEVTSAVTLELGYRYLNLGDVSSGEVYDYTGNFSYKALELDDLHSHDLMIGMRWKLDQPAPSYTAMK